VDEPLGGHRGHSRPKSNWIDRVEEDARNWVLEIGWQMPRIEIAGDICLRRPRPTQGSRANDDEDDTDQLVLSNI